MKLSAKSVMFASALLWGGAVLVVGLANIKWVGYGQVFLNVLDSIYPGYDVAPTPTLRSVLWGTLYGFLNGAIVGFIFAWLYNWCACQKSASGRK